ncbi:hypothetical protein ACHAWF_013617, partial [Thalassiosira exigua]
DQDFLVDIPNDTCVGSGICKECKYPLRHFLKRCHKDHSPGDVTEDGRCKLCKELGNDAFLIKLREKAEDDDVDCGRIGRVVVDQVGGALVEQNVPGMDLRFGPMQIKARKEKGHCSVVMSYSPNSSQTPDKVVLDSLKASVRAIVKGHLFFERLHKEHPGMSDFITSIAVLDGDNAKEMERSVS